MQNTWTQENTSQAGKQKLFKGRNWRAEKGRWQTLLRNTVKTCRVWNLQLLRWKMKRRRKYTGWKMKRTISYTFCAFVCTHRSCRLCVMTTVCFSYVPLSWLHGCPTCSCPQFSCLFLLLRYWCLVILLVFGVHTKLKNTKKFHVCSDLTYLCFFMHDVYLLSASVGYRMLISMRSFLVFSHLQLFSYTHAMLICNCLKLWLWSKVPPEKVKGTCSLWLKAWGQIFDTKVELLCTQTRQLLTVSAMCPTHCDV